MRPRISIRGSVRPSHCRLWIGLGGSFGIWMTIFISATRLKLCRIVKVTYEHALPVHMAAFLPFLSKKKAPKVDSFTKITKFQLKSINFRLSVENEKKLMKSPSLD